VIKKYCFSGCSRLAEVIFEEGSELKEIEDSSFSSCRIQQISIPEKCSVIGDLCFAWCSDLFDVKFPESSCVKRLEYQAFYGTRVKEICLPASLDFVDASALPDDCNVTVYNSDLWEELVVWGRCHRINPKMTFQRTPGIEGDWPL
jgi:hypothetical protein